MLIVLLLYQFITIVIYKIIGGNIMEEIIKIVCTTGVSTLGLIASVIVAIVQSIKKGNVKKQDSIYEKMLDSME